VYLQESQTHDLSIFCWCPTPPMPKISARVYCSTMTSSTFQCGIIQKYSKALSICLHKIDKTIYYLEKVFFEDFNIL
jgi:hypothetical protein